MKNTILTFITFAGAVFGQELEPPVFNEPKPTSEFQPTLKAKDLTLNREPKKFFGYFSLGACGFLLPYNPEVSFGIRKLQSHHVWDFNAGVSARLEYVWSQGSYLYYFNTPTNSYSSPYLGVGLTVGRVVTPKSYNLEKKSYFFANLPITVGYQFGKNRGNQFFQVQVTPLYVTTLSYGFGF